MSDSNMDNRRENYIKSLEGFMIKVAKELKCLPDFVDPENGNDHLFRMLEKLSSPKNETVEQLEESPIDKAKRELQGYQDVLSKVWNEDLTDEQELLYLKFYQEGIKIASSHGKSE